MSEMTFASVMKLSFVLPILLLASMVLGAVFLERVWTYWRWARLRNRFLAGVLAAARAGNLAEARRLSAADGGIVGASLTELLDGALGGLSQARLAQILDLNVRRAQALLSSRLSVFGTLSFVAPLLGLLGTVLGVMRAFRDLAFAGQGGPAVVAGGISEALIATAAGIGVAVSAALLNNAFNARAKLILNRLDVAAQEILLVIEIERDKTKGV